ncbi:MAG: manganese efflux pump, partial [Candidatus Aminicenantales bacterium]
AFAVGLGFAALGLAMLAPAVIIGAVAFGMSLLGCSIGPYLGRVAGKGAELLGGAILILIAFRILFEHIRPV